MASLQDQLLKAGLVKKQNAKKIQADKRKAQNQSRKSNTVVENEAALLAEQAQQEAKRKSQLLNEKRQQEAEKKAIAAQIKQIIEMNSIDRSEGEVESLTSFNFTEQNSNTKKIKTLQLSAKNHGLVSRGQIAIAKLQDNYHLIPVAAAEKIMQRDISYIALLNPTETTDDTSQNGEDDFYADMQVPDDLMW
jgi:uncharacterized protein YaiL (DUF2058 family)